jgi:hypothetical protein
MCLSTVCMRQSCRSKGGGCMAREPTVDASVSHGCTTERQPQLSGSSAPRHASTTRRNRNPLNGCLPVIHFQNPDYSTRLSFVSRNLSHVLRIALPPNAAAWTPVLDSRFLIIMQTQLRNYAAGRNVRPFGPARPAARTLVQRRAAEVATPAAAPALFTGARASTWAGLHPRHHRGWFGSSGLVQRCWRTAHVCPKCPQTRGAYPTPHPSLRAGSGLPGLQEVPPFPGERPGILPRSLPTPPINPGAACPTRHPHPLSVGARQHALNPRPPAPSAHPHRSWTSPLM